MQFCYVAMLSSQREMIVVSSRSLSIFITHQYAAKHKN